MEIFIICEAYETKVMEISIICEAYETKVMEISFFFVAYETKITFSLVVLPQLNLFVGHLNARSNTD